MIKKFARGPTYGCFSHHKRHNWLKNTKNNYNEQKNDAKMLVTSQDMIEFFFLIMLKISNMFVKIDLTKQLTNYSQNRCQRIRMTDMDK